MQPTNSSAMSGVQMQMTPWPVNIWIDVMIVGLLFAFYITHFVWSFDKQAAKRSLSMWPTLFASSSPAVEQEVSKQRSERAGVLTATLGELFRGLNLCLLAFRFINIMEHGSPPQPLWIVLAFQSMGMIPFVVLCKHRGDLALTVCTHGFVLVSALFVVMPPSLLATLWQAALTVRMVTTLVVPPVHALPANLLMSAAKIFNTGYNTGDFAAVLLDVGMELFFCSGLAFVMAGIRKLDVEAAHRTLEALQKDEAAQAFVGILNSLTDAVFMLDGKRRIVQPTPHAAAALGTNINKLKGMSIDDVLPDEADRNRLATMCEEFHPNGIARHVADQLVVGIKTLGQQISMGAQMFHMRLPDGGDAKHVIGICWRSAKEETFINGEEDLVPDAAGVQTAPIRHRTKTATRSTRSGVTSVSSWAKSSQASQVDSSVRVVIDLSTPKFDFVSCTDSFEEFCDMETETCLVDFFGADISNALMKEIEDEAKLAYSTRWSATKACRKVLGKMNMKSKVDGQVYRFRLVLSMPEPLLVEGNDGYMVVLCLENPKIRLSADVLQSLKSDTE